MKAPHEDQYAIYSYGLCACQAQCQVISRAPAAGRAAICSPSHPQVPSAVHFAAMAEETKANMVEKVDDLHGIVSGRQRGSWD